MVKVVEEDIGVLHQDLEENLFIPMIDVMNVVIGDIMQGIVQGIRGVGDTGMYFIISLIRK